MGTSPMGKRKETFGKFVRRRRMEEKFTLREFARRVGVSPTYMSQVEQDVADPPTVERVRAIAKLLNENADELIAMAGRVPDDIPGIIQKQPTEMPALLRAVSGLTPEQLRRFTEEAKKLKKDKGK
jgi:transcriptional regulator with XRE-family HTH domain